ncbi:MAG: PD-(D/E)XK nuclease family protein [Firmicutes bacterium]|nr:PD-(D/E)XK nuclease family protein [Bacillota bacterium]
MLLIQSKDFHSSFKAVLGDLQKREVSLKQRHFIIVPDKCSLYCERFFFAQNNSGAFDVEILTFSRLADKLIKPCGAEALPKSGAVMLVKKIVNALKNKFKVFKSGAHFHGFAEKLYEAFCFAAAAGLTADDLACADSVKLADIAPVYAQYLNETQQLFIDNIGKMRLLREAAQTAALSDIHFYAAGFDRFNKTEQDILNILSHRAASFRLYEAEPARAEFGDVEFYEAASYSERLKAAAKRIRHGLKSGARLSDFCVLTSDEQLYAPLSRIFTEFEIPFYIDKKMKASESELFRYIELCFAAQSLRRETLTALAKNHYAGISAAESEIFENYVHAHAVNFARFSRPFERIYETDAEAEKIAESVRARIIKLVSLFGQEFNHANSPEKFYAFLQAVLSSADAAAKTAELSEFAGVDLSQINRKLLETARLLTKTASESSRPSEYFELFCQGARSTEITLLPPVADAVTVGGAETFRGGKFACVFVLDFSEGSVPPLIEDTGLIADADAACLDADGASGFLTAAERNRLARDEVIRLFSLSDKLFLAHGPNRVSHLARTVRSGAKSIAQNSAVQENAWLYDADACQTARAQNDAAYFARAARHISTKANALEMLIVSQSEVRAQRPALPMAASILAAAGGADTARFLGSGLVGIQNLRGAGALFFRSRAVSVSRITRYFECPYKCFAQNALGLSKRDTGELTPPEAGSFLHRAAELFVKEGSFENAQLSMRQIAQALLDGEFKLLADKNQRTAQALVSEATQLSARIADSFTKGQFKNYGAELRFGFNDKNDLQTVSFSVPDAAQSAITLRGKMDRVDVYGKYARVIDYKSGAAASLNSRSVYYGVGLQLPLYLRVLRQNGFLPAGAFYFPLSLRRAQNTSRYVLNGVYNRAEEVLLAADIGLSGAGYKSSVIAAQRNVKAAKDGSIPIRKSTYALTQADLDALADYAERAVENALCELHEGYIAAAPNENACERCDYGAVCGFDKQTGKRRVYAKAQPSLSES